ncbi:MAG: hypothetical protein IK139_05385 [Lachnospiraceae bacterium]|nr:hypothetical protein [Lachnospiraceae bacterium]
MTAWNDTWLKCKINLVSRPNRQNLDNVIKMTGSLIALKRFEKKQGDRR